ncbi:MAG: ubiquinol-cytochrome c reductase iron-sulfur subunit [Acidocella sp.]|nr:ubiquinol-cytochrome c reductase iron-sulfur subunit [Acidocella sp.]
MAEDLAQVEAVAGETISEVRRDFLKILTAMSVAVGLGAIAWPLISALGPDEDANAAAALIVDIGNIAENTAIRVVWQGLPVYIRKLTKQQIADNRAVVPGTLPDPASFNDRVKPGFESYVVVVGLNTGTPCELEGNAPAEPRGAFDGWLCPCDGSVYDPLGRVRSGPAPRNLAIPRFAFLNAAQIQFG